MTTAMITLDPRVKKSIKQLSRRLRDLARTQIPFALSKMLNDTAFDVRHDTVNRVYPNAFQVRNRRFAGSAFRVKRATKRMLEAHVFDRFNKDWLARQVTGGTKTARARYLTVPVAASRSARGTRDPRTYSKSFIGKTRDGRKAIFQRFGRGGKNVRMLFALKPSVTINREFRFVEEGRKTAARTYGDNWDKAFTQAMRTARLK